MSEPTRLSRDASADDALREALLGARRAVPSPEVFEALAQQALAALPPARRPGVDLLKYGALAVVAALALVFLLRPYAAEKKRLPASSQPAPEVRSAPPSAAPANAAPEQIEQTKQTEQTEQTTQRPRRIRRNVSLPAAMRTPADEVLLLQRAKKQVLAAPARALSLVEEHERDFLEGSFREEREALAVETLWRLQRTKQARARFEEFVRRYPRSAYRERLETWLGNGAP